jgi:hypothetical protein
MELHLLYVEEGIAVRFFLLQVTEVNYLIIRG